MKILKYITIITTRLKDVYIHELLNPDVDDEQHLCICKIIDKFIEIEDLLKECER